jgi:hypothetical protein
MCHYGVRRGAEQAKLHDPVWSLAMAGDVGNVRSGERIDLGRLWWAGPLTVAAALAANAIVRTVAVGLFEISPLFHNLAWMHVTWVTVAAVNSAVLVFAAIARYADRPISVYLRVAAVALVVSFIPNAWLVLTDVPGSSPAAHATLMAMHVVDAAICAYLLPALTRSREPGVQPWGDQYEATISTR